MDAKPLDLRPKRYCTRCGEHHAREDFLEGCATYAGNKPIRACKTCGGSHPLDMWPHNCMPARNENRSDLPAPQVIRDGLPDLESMASGKIYDSKRGLRAEYRALGVEEVGDQKVTAKRWEPSEAEIAADVRKELEIWSSDNLSNDQMANMLRSEAPTNDGITII